MRTKIEKMPEHKRKALVTLFNEETLELLRKRKFDGDLEVSWKDGEVCSFNMQTRIGFNVRRRREHGPDFFPYDDFDD